MVYLKATPPMENILPSIEWELLANLHAKPSSNVLSFLWFFLFFLFFQFYDVGKVTSHNHPKETLAKFGYNTYMGKNIYFIFQLIL
jgi:hypothetical protein